jgi:hypothetical protein
MAMDCETRRKRPQSLPKAGLDRDTKFDLGDMVRLSFDTEWFRTDASASIPSAARSTSKTRSSRELFRLPSSKQRKPAASDVSLANSHIRGGELTFQVR